MSICIEELKHTSAKEFDHEPSIHQLRENILGQLICKLKLPAGCDNTLVIYKATKIVRIDVEMLLCPN